MNRLKIFDFDLSASIFKLYKLEMNFVLSPII